MTTKARIVLLIVMALGIGGAAAGFSWSRARQGPDDAQHGNTRSTEDHDHGALAPPEHNHAEAEQGQDAHAEDGHEDASDHAEHDDHVEAGSDEVAGAQDTHAGHDHGSEGSLVRLSPAERERFGVGLAVAGAGALATRLTLPGEIVLNADRVAHIVPHAEGIVREVLVRVGDQVSAGQVLAWIESADVGAAKVAYLTRSAELGCCTLDLTRAQAVHDSTIRLMELLDMSPTLEALRETNGSAMGDNRIALVSSYAEVVRTEAAYAREKLLLEKNATSERDYQAVEADYRKADALYAATRDSAAFNVRRDLLEARRTQQVNAIELQGARRRLIVLGLTAEEIAEVELLAQPQDRLTAHAAGCSDPNCTSCKHAGAASPVAADVEEAEARLAWCSLRAPFDGTVIEKHLTLGEQRSAGSDALTIADLTFVWVDVAVYQKDLVHVKEGLSVTISAGADLPEVQGSIAYVSPMVDEQTRTARARVVLPNEGGTWRPGLFVTATLATGAETASVVVPAAAVQRLGAEPVVFVEVGDGFESVPVTLGRSAGGRVEVLSGLTAGQRYVVAGAFELKAQIVTSGLDPHAGHGH